LKKIYVILKLGLILFLYIFSGNLAYGGNNDDGITPTGRQID